MAFEYFAKEQVDIAVIETGMGGRLDSTNIITPLISIITNISKDHTAFLGDTLPAIAKEKAGIIKPGVPVIIGETQPDVNHVFTAKANDEGSAIYFADHNYKLIKESPSSGQFKITGTKEMADAHTGPVFDCPLKGLYQEKNFITAYQTAILLRESGFNLSERDIKQGFKDVIRKTGLQGRWQIIHSGPRTICDVGHNEAGIRYIIEQLNTEKFSELHWVFGLVNDKDADSVMALLPVSATYYFCKANIPRGLDVSELLKKAEKFGLKGDKYASVQEAFLAARKAAQPDDLIFIGGSTFVVAEVL
jgi:dihydrofolate synthase/folylpolyglutamate synthase